MSGLTPPPPIKDGAKPATTPGCGGCLLLLGIPIVLLVIVVAGISIFGGGESGSSNEQSGLARIYCERAVEERLVSPASAQFTHDSTTGANPYEVRGTVDSDNSFGATLRTGYGCTVTFTGDSYTVTVDYLL